MSWSHKPEHIKAQMQEMIQDNDRSELPAPDSSALREVQKLVDNQAEDEGLWFIAETAGEAYLQQELRRLHALIEQHDNPHPERAGASCGASDGSAFLRVIVETHDSRLELDTRTGLCAHLEARAVDAIRQGCVGLMIARSNDPSSATGREQPRRMDNTTTPEPQKPGQFAGDGSANVNWICYECAAGIVNSGGRSLTEIWGANQTPHKQGVCGKCGKQDTLCQYPRCYWPNDEMRDRRDSHPSKPKDQPNDNQS